MITYQSHLFGLPLLTRAHGSAVYRAVIPSLLSTAILLIGVYVFDNPIDENQVDPVIKQNFAIGAFIGFFTFLVTFRASFAYGRVSLKMIETILKQCATRIRLTPSPSSAPPLLQSTGKGPLIFTTCCPNGWILE